MFRPLLAIAVVAASAIVSPALAAEKVPSPYYVSWAKHKPGTTVILKQTMKMAAMSIEAKTHMELKTVTPDNVTVQSWTVATVMGKTQESPKKTETLPATVDKGSEEIPVGFNGKAEVIGDEKVSVGGKEYDCKVIHFTGTEKGTKSDGKAWASDAVPGRTVKLEMKVTGDTEMTMNGELADVKIKE